MNNNGGFLFDGSVAFNLPANRFQCPFYDYRSVQESGLSGGISKNRDEMNSLLNSTLIKPVSSAVVKFER